MKKTMMAFVIAVIATAGVLLAREQEVKTVDVSYRGMTAQDRQSVLAYLSNKVVIAKGQKPIQFSFPEYGRHGTSYDSVGRGFGGSTGWFSKGDYATLWGEYGLRHVFGEVLQSAGDGLYRVKQGTTGVIAVHVPNSPSLVDGSFVDNWVVADGMYEYVTVLGATKRIDKFKAIETVALNEQSLWSALTNGATFLVPSIVNKVTCPKCRGGWNFDKKNCSECNGTGKVEQATIKRIIP
jgi:hypothetical protein